MGLELRSVDASTKSWKPGFAEDELEALKRFGAYLEQHRDEVRTRVTATAPQALAAGKTESDRSARLEQRALQGVEWGPYVENLQVQGQRYADAGIDLREWFPLVRGAKSILLPKALIEFRDDHDALRQVILGMELHIDNAMALVAGAYLTRKRQLLAEARQNLELFERMFEHASLGMRIFEWESPPDPGSFRLIALNEAAAVIAGAPVDGLRDREVGKMLAEFAPHVMQTDVPQRYARCMREGEADVWEMSTKRDGRRADYSLQCFRLSEQYLGVVYEEISERKHMQRKIARYVRDLERSNRELDDFAYVASHDLKSPLRDIQNLSSWISEDLADTLPDASARHLQQLRERTGRMERLLEDLLQYSRAGRVVPASERHTVRAAISSALAIVAPPEAFTVEVEGDDPVLFGPRPPLEVIIRNLVSNAIKHHDRDAGSVRILVEDGEDAIRLTVTDDGPGIPPQFHQRVFRMFQTLKPRDEVEGSGIGLSIVSKIVDHFGGTVSLESSGERGAAFSFPWPKSVE